VLAGDPRTIDTLDSVLRDSGMSTITIAANLEGLRTKEALGRLEAALETLSTETSLERARVIQEEAAAGASGACGLARVLAALNEARVASLLIDPSRTYAGLVEPGEILGTAAGAEGAVDLTDLIVSRALSTGAGVPGTEMRPSSLELRRNCCASPLVRIRWSLRSF
jgi:hypothetical protein